MASDAERMAAFREKRKQEADELLRDMDRLRSALRRLGSRGVFMPVTLVRGDGRQTLAAVVAHFESLAIQAEKEKRA